MYILIQTLENEQTTAGDVLVLKCDRTFGRIGAYAVGGSVVGYAAERQPDGCVDTWTMVSHIFDYRVLCRVVVRLNGQLLLFTDSPVFGTHTTYRRIEREGYAILTAE